MKKIILILAIFGFGFCFSQEWDNNVSFGICFPQVKETVQDAGLDANMSTTDMNIKGRAIAFQVKDVITYKHFALFTDVNIGGMKTSDIFGEESTGFYFNGNVGVGVAIVNNDKFTFALGGVLGLVMSKFSGDMQYNYAGYKVKIEETITPILFNYGFDLYATYHFGKVFGIYVDLKTMWNVGDTMVDAKANVRGYSALGFDDYHSKGFIFTPAVGISFRF